MQPVVSPSERIVATAGATVRVMDTLGRTMDVRRPGALERLRLFKALGAGLSQNSLYLGYAMLAVCVVAIDDVPVPQPGTTALMEGLIGRLGDEGLVAVGQALFDAGMGSEVGVLSEAGVAGAGPGNGAARPE